jgi:hypothetical protein
MDSPVRWINRYNVRYVENWDLCSSGRTWAGSGRTPVSTLVPNPASPRSTYRCLPRGRFPLNALGALGCCWVQIGED